MGWGLLAGAEKTYSAVFLQSESAVKVFGDKAKVLCGYYLYIYWVFGDKAKVLYLDIYWVSGVKGHLLGVWGVGCYERDIFWMFGGMAKVLHAVVWLSIGLFGVLPVVKGISIGCYTKVG